MDKFLNTCLKKQAFTLAEVLITIAIIGVVAVITMPALVKNYQQSVIENKIKWFFSNIHETHGLSCLYL